MRNDVLQTRLNLLYKELATTREQLAVVQELQAAPAAVVQVKTLWQRIREVFMPS
jgi:hypothetical protein